MRRILIYSLLFISVISLLTCTKLKKEMSVETGEAINVSVTSSVLPGVVIDLGEGAIQHGHCYGTSPNVTIDNIKTSLGEPIKGAFTSELTGLNPGTKYYFKAYLSSGSKIIFGKEKYFTTISISTPSLSTTGITNITQTTASGGGNITSDGGASITARGVCWSTTSNPLATGDHSSDGTSTGTFSSSITGLTASTTYYVRAYATNSIGTAYGNEITFTTSAVVPVLPTLSTTGITNITQTTASGGGNITSDGGASITARGVCWSTTSNPLATGDHSSDGTSTGTFSSSITGLTASTTYYVRAYATNSIGTAYGNEITFTTIAPSIPETVMDNDGNTYNTVVIGTQTWMRENLKTTKYNDGTEIPNITDATSWAGLTSGAYCNYDNIPANSDTYGRLYNWYVVAPTNPLNVCPTGWHVPSDLEWSTLNDYLGGATIAGGKLKQTGTTLWSSPNTGATNETGFTALPGGHRYYAGYLFYNKGLIATWWSSTENGIPFAYYREIRWESSAFTRYGFEKGQGLSIRCVKD